MAFPPSILFFAADDLVDTMREVDPFLALRVTGIIVARNEIVNNTPARTLNLRAYNNGIYFNDEDPKGTQGNRTVLSSMRRTGSCIFNA